MNYQELLHAYMSKCTESTRRRLEAEKISNELETVLTDMESVDGYIYLLNETIIDICDKLGTIPGPIKMIYERTKALKEYTETCLNGYNRFD